MPHAQAVATSCAPDRVEVGVVGVLLSDGPESGDRAVPEPEQPVMRVGTIVAGSCPAGSLLGCGHEAAGGVAGAEHAVRRPPHVTDDVAVLDQDGPVLVALTDAELGPSLVLGDTGQDEVGDVHGLMLTRRDRARRARVGTDGLTRLLRSGLVVGCDDQDEAPCRPVDGDEFVEARRPHHPTPVMLSVRAEVWEVVQRGHREKWEDPLLEDHVGL